MGLDIPESVLVGSAIPATLLTLICFEQIFATPIYLSYFSRNYDYRPFFIYRTLNLLISITELSFLIVCFFEYQLAHESTRLSILRYSIDTSRYVFLSIALLLFSTDTLEYQFQLHINKSLPSCIRALFMSLCFLFNLTLFGAIAAAIYTQSSLYWALQLIHWKVDLVIGCAVATASLIYLRHAFVKKITHYIDDLQSQSNFPQFRAKIFHAKCKLNALIVLLISCAVLQAFYIPIGISHGISHDTDIRLPPWMISTPLEFVLERILLNIILAIFIYWILDKNYPCSSSHDKSGSTIATDEYKTCLMYCVTGKHCYLTGMGCFLHCLAMFMSAVPPFCICKCCHRCYDTTDDKMHEWKRNQSHFKEREAALSLHYKRRHSIRSQKRRSRRFSATVSRTPMSKVAGSRIVSPYDHRYSIELPSELHALGVMHDPVDGHVGPSAGAANLFGINQFGYNDRVLQPNAFPLTVMSGGGAQPTHVYNNITDDSFSSIPTYEYSDIPMIKRNSETDPMPTGAALLKSVSLPPSASLGLQPGRRASVPVNSVLGIRQDSNHSGDASDRGRIATIVEGDMTPEPSESESSLSEDGSFHSISESNDRANDSARSTVMSDTEAASANKRRGSVDIDPTDIVLPSPQHTRTTSDSKEKNITSGSSADDEEEALSDEDDDVLSESSESDMDAEEMPLASAAVKGGKHRRRVSVGREIVLEPMSSFAPFHLTGGDNSKKKRKKRGVSTDTGMNQLVIGIDDSPRSDSDPNSKKHHKFATIHDGMVLDPGSPHSVSIEFQTDELPL